jgi:hypothetical protein
VFFTKKRLRLYLGALLVMQLVTCIRTVPLIRGRYIDFRSFYVAGAMIRTGHRFSLYDYAAEEQLQSALVSPKPRALPLMSPAYTALPFAPLSKVPFWTAYLIFWCVNLLALTVSAALLYPFLSTIALRWKLAPLVLVLSFFPVAIALMFGQITLLLLLIFCCCFVALQHGRNVVAGLVLSLAMMKFQIALPVGLLFLAWRQWNFFGGFLGGTICLGIISTMISGLQSFVPYLHSLYSMSQSIIADPANQLRFGILPVLMPNVYGLLFEISGGAHWGATFTILASAALFVWAVSRPPSLPFAILIAILVSYHLFLYDLALAILPLSLLLDRSVERFDGVTSSPSRTGTSYRDGLAMTALGALLLLPRFIPPTRSGALAIPLLVLAILQLEWPPLRRDKANQRRP